MADDQRFHAMAELAWSQRGLITRKQLAAIGFSGYRVTRLVRGGWLRVVRAGVLALGTAKPSPWESAIAASLLAGPSAAISHRSAAAIHDFPGILLPGKPELSVPARRNPRLEEVTIHRVSCLDDRDVVRKYNVAITSPVRTIVDLAGEVQDDLLARIVDEGTVSRRWTAREILLTAQRVGARGRRGQQRIRRILLPRLDERPSDSMFELRVIRVLEPYAPFRVHHQLVLDGRLIILDIAWPQWKVGAECDGFAAHDGSRRRFDRDREAMNLLLAHGWRVVRLTSTMDRSAVLRAVGVHLPATAVVGKG